MHLNPYPAGTKSMQLAFATRIEPEQPALFWPSSILLTDQLQLLILISLKLIIDSSKNGRWIIPLRNSAGEGLIIYAEEQKLSFFFQFCS